MQVSLYPFIHSFYTLQEKGEWQEDMHAAGETMVLLRHMFSLWFWMLMVLPWVLNTQFGISSVPVIPVSDLCYSDWKTRPDLTLETKDKP